jgi:DNA-binding NarL/FixJ family response regulator
MPRELLYLLSMLALRGALADVVEASREAVVLGEFAREALDGLRRAFDCNLGCITHSPYDGAIDIISCTDARVLGEYRRDWFESDPINAALCRYDTSWIVPATRLPEWNSMQSHPLYAEWAPSKNVRFLLHLRLSEAPYLKAGATNIFLCRPKENADFSHREFIAVSQVMPDLETAVHRCSRITAMNSASPFLESLLDDAEGRARLALRADGRLVWASKAAQRLLAGHLGRSRSLPAALTEKARKVASGATTSADLRFVAGGVCVTATVQTAFATTGEPFVVIGFCLPFGALPHEVRERYGLTAAEADVLSDLAEGLSNAEIAQRRFVSITTVRTHVAHILSKLGVRSRLQAGVLARTAM